MRTMFTSIVMATGVAATLFAAVPSDATYYYHPAPQHHRLYTQNWNRQNWNRQNWNRHDWNRQDWNRQDWNRQDWNRQDWNRQDWNR